MSRPTPEELETVLKRDLRRHREREPGGRSFWRSLSLIGAVGWSIVLPAAGGALLGHRLDLRWGTGIRWTLVLLVLGVLLGSAAAWRVIQGYR